MVTRSSIDEANKHLQALYMRVQELENTVDNQQRTLIAKDEQLVHKVQDVIDIKDVEITELTANLLSTREKLRAVENMLREKDELIKKLQDRCRILDRVMSFQPALESLLTTLASGGAMSDSGISTSDGPIDEYSNHSSKPGYRGSAIRRMAKSFSHASRRKQFSISEDDDEDQNADTEGDSSDEKLPEKELYL